MSDNEKLLLRQLMDVVFTILEKRIRISPLTIDYNKCDPFYWNGGDYYNSDHGCYRVLEQDLVLDSKFFNALVQLNSKQKEEMLFTLEESILKGI